MDILRTTFNVPENINWLFNLTWKIQARKIKIPRRIFGGMRVSQPGTKIFTASTGLRKKNRSPPPERTNKFDCFLFKISKCVKKDRGDWAVGSAFYIFKRNFLAWIEGLMTPHPGKQWHPLSRIWFFGKGRAWSRVFIQVWWLTIKNLLLFSKVVKTFFTRSVP